MPRLLAVLLWCSFLSLPVRGQENLRELTAWQMHMGDAPREDGSWISLNTAYPPALDQEELGSGIAWFRCEIQGSNQPMAMTFLARWRAVEVFWDGHRIGGAGRIDTLTQYGPRDAYVVLPLPREPGSHCLELRVQVGVHDRLTHSIKRIALEKPVLVGLDPAVREKAQALTATESWNRLKERLPYLILVVVFTAMGLWYLQFYFCRRNAREHLWFGLLLLCMAFHQFGVGGWPKDWPLPSYRVSQVLFVQYYVACVLLMEFLRSLSGATTGRWLRKFQWSFLLPVIALFILPPAQSMWFARRIGGLLVLPILLVLILSMVRARRERHSDTPYLFAGVVSLFLGGVIEAAYFLGLTKSVDALGIAFTLFLVCMAALVNARNARAYEETERLSKDLAQQIQERERMFNEIHDGFRAQLGEAVRQVGNAAHPMDAEETGQLPVLGTILDHCLGELRDLMWIMQDESVTLADLALHLREHLILHLAPHGLELDYASSFANPDQEVSRSLRFHLFRIIQEWSTNTLKHARARQVSLRLQELDGQLAIRYTDDGIGFDEALPLLPDHGLDLLNHRCQQLRGQLTLRSEPGKGFQATLHLPLAGPTDAVVRSSDG